MATHQKKHVQSNGKITSKILRIVESSDGENYAKILQILGGCRFKIEIINTGENKIATLCGKIRKGTKKQKVGIGDIVLILEGDKINDSIIEYKYSEDEVKKLYKQGEIKDIKPKSGEESGIAFEDEITNENEENEEPIDITDI